MKKIVTLFLPFTLLSCVRTKSNYWFTSSLNVKDGGSCKCKLYVEVYHAGLLKNMTADYLTDSTSFRKYIGTFDDDNGHYCYHCFKDSISIEELKKSEPDTQKIIDRKVFSISDLRKQKNYN